MKPESSVLFPWPKSPPTASTDLQIVELVIGHPVERFLGLNNSGVRGLDVAHGRHDHGAVVGRHQVLTLPGTDAAMALLHLVGL